jgi:hypothetical protein
MQVKDAGVDLVRYVQVRSSTALSVKIGGGLTCDAVPPRAKGQGCPRAASQGQWGQHDAYAV